MGVRIDAQPGVASRARVWHSTLGGKSAMMRLYVVDLLRWKDKATGTGYGMYSNSRIFSRFPFSRCGLVSHLQKVAQTQALKWLYSSVQGI